MPNFTISFAGLILHRAKDDGSKSAILVHAHHHVPQLVIHVGSRVSDEIGWRGKSNGFYLAYDLHDCVVTIDDADKSSVVAGKSFLGHVPRLQEILETPFDPVKDDLETDVKNKKPKKDVAAAYVDYSGGTLSVLNCFPKEADFESHVPGYPRCIGKTIQFVGKTTTSGSQVTINNGKGHSLVVLGGSEIGIMNTAKEWGHHNVEYGRLLKSKKRPLHMVERGQCTACVTSEGTFEELKESRGKQVSKVLSRWSLSIECSNSQWP